MEVIRVNKQQADGSHVVEMRLTDEQMTFLLSFAVGQLVNAGIAKFIDVEEGEEEEEEEGAVPEPAVTLSKLN